MNDYTAERRLNLLFSKFKFRNHKFYEINLFVGVCCALFVCL